MARRVSCRVTANDGNLTVEKVLRVSIGLTRHQISRLKFTEDGIWLNGRRARVSETVHPGDEVSARLDEEGRAAGGRCSGVHGRGAGNVQVSSLLLYEDDDLLIVNKPAGMLVHRGRGHYGDTLADVVADHDRDMTDDHASDDRRDAVPVFHAVGRLDKDTSGAVVVAKHPVAAQRLSQRGGIAKTYLALVRGVPEQTDFSIDLPIRKKPESLNEMEVSPDGKAARTNCHVCADFQTYSLVELRLETGRTHQIRVHMAAAGHPLLGDPVYGEPWPGLERAALHCGRVSLRQPFTGEMISIDIPLPVDMQALCADV